MGSWRGGLESWLGAIYSEQQKPDNVAVEEVVHIFAVSFCARFRSQVISRCIGPVDGHTHRVDKFVSRRVSFSVFPFYMETCMILREAGEI
jgi:hypothetical protein